MDRDDLSGGTREHARRRHAADVDDERVGPRKRGDVPGRTLGLFGSRRRCLVVASPKRAQRHDGVRIGGEGLTGDRRGPGGEGRGGARVAEDEEVRHRPLRGAPQSHGLDERRELVALRTVHARDDDVGVCVA